MDFKKTVLIFLTVVFITVDSGRQHDIEVYSSVSGAEFSTFLYNQQLIICSYIYYDIPTSLLSLHIIAQFLNKYI